MQYKGLTLDPFQEEAIAAIDQNQSVVVSAPTGSGKTLIADYIIGLYGGQGKKVIYTAPIKALSNQKYKEFSDEFGKENVGLLTGDVVINRGAKILIMTTEIYRNMALTQDESLNNISYVVFDEIHYINDIERGYVWEESIIFSQEHVRFLCLSATIPNALEFSKWIKSIKHHQVQTVIHDKRPVPLHTFFYDAELGISTLKEIRDAADVPDYRYVTGRSHRRRPRTSPPNHIELLKDIKDKLPCFFFQFSREGCQKSARELARANLFKINHDIAVIVRKKLEGATSEIKQLKSTRLLREVLPYGIAFHHAGLIPIIKELVEELFAKGLIRVLFTTETFAVGINMPAKTVCFKSLRKFDGANFRYLNSKEFFQIAGRAGRRGIDQEGYVYAMIDRRDFNYQTLKRMTDRDIEPIKSQFRLSVNTVLNIINRHSDKEIDKILHMSFYTYQQKTPGKILHSFKKIKKKLIALEYLQNNTLTRKGKFSSKIYADEILTGELFATSFYSELNEYQLMLIIAALSFEGKEKNEFGKFYKTSDLQLLKKKLWTVRQVHGDDRFNYLDALTSFIYPCYHGATLFTLLKDTNLLEGDLIRLFRQMLDRFGQIRQATEDLRLQQTIKSCELIITESLADIDAI